MTISAADFYRSTPREPSELAKRAFDIVGAALILLLAMPLILLAALLISLDGAGVLFAHRRIGRHGRPFRCWKLRTMQPDSPDRLAAILRDDPDAAREWARSYKLADDPRVTPIGRLLRRLRIDELPQLWNVFTGEMSLVGPRPITREELVAYGRTARLYCAVRPGLTGLWQVEGDAETSYAERISMDRHYIENRSLAGDLMIVLRTGAVVLRQTGR